jgi:hypothetical protein
MLNWKAILIGAAVDFIGSYFVTMIFAHLWGGALQLGGLSVDSAQDATFNNPLFLAISVAQGWYFDYMGGKIAASFADGRKALHAVLAVVPGIVFGLFEIFTAPSLNYPIWFDCALSFASIGFGYYGGARQRR